MSATTAINNLNLKKRFACIEGAQINMENQATGITLEKINAIGDRLCLLSNEAEHGFAESKAIAVRLIEECQHHKKCHDSCNRHYTDVHCAITKILDEAGISKEYHGLTWRVEIAIDRMAKAEAGADAPRAELHTERATLQEIIKMNEQCKQERDGAVRKAYDLSRQLGAAQGERDQAIMQGRQHIRKLAEQTEKLNEIIAASVEANNIAIGISGDDLAPLYAAIANVLNLIGQESEAASVLVCPRNEPMHFHHDGCPSCMEIEEWAWEIARDVLTDLSKCWSNPGYNWTAKDISSVQTTIFRHLSERAAWRKSTDHRVNIPETIQQPVTFNPSADQLTEDRVREIVREETANNVRRLCSDQVDEIVRLRKAVDVLQESLFNERNKTRTAIAL